MTELLCLSPRYGKRPLPPLTVETGGRDGVSDGSKRITQLVSEHREELVLLAICRHKALLGLLTLRDVGDHRHPPVADSVLVHRGCVRGCDPPGSDALEGHMRLVIDDLSRQHALEIWTQLLEGLRSQDVRDRPTHDVVDGSTYPFGVRLADPQVSHVPTAPCDRGCHAVGYDLELLSRRSYGLLSALTLEII